MDADLVKRINKLESNIAALKEELAVSSASFLNIVGRNC